MKLWQRVCYHNALPQHVMVLITFLQILQRNVDTLQRIVRKRVVTFSQRVAAIRYDPGLLYKRIMIYSGGCFTLAT